MEERSEHEQFVKKEIQALLLKLFKTEQLHQTQDAVLQNKQEKLAKAASDVLEQKRRMAMSREKYLEHHMKKAS
ncbi:hypothetical protein ANANG_G00034930 [Anguilla anguilla]|uniref:Uncharacterized protein n=1 Tax=Anguilla anguilla TaxID=7936 RepID=A0A9D3MSZ7_ANGAN|nr:hypothetical protein ANANG_G00034930 [Anguilla anguilla]